MKAILKFTSIFLFLFCVGISLGLKHQSNDDFDMILIAKGGDLFNSSAFIYYSSIVLGWIYKLLYQFFPKIEWYNFIYLFLISLSFSKLFYLVLRFYKGSYQLLIFYFILFFWIFLGVFLTDVQFTLAAGLLTGNAFLSLIIVYDNQRSISINFYIIILIEILLGSFYRFQMFELISIYFIILFITIRISKGEFRLFFKNYLHVGVVISLILIPLIFGRIENALLSSEQKKFVNLHKAGAQFGDFLILQKISNKESLLKKVGWQKNDLDIMRTWSYPDFKEYNESTLNYIINHANKDKFYSFDYLLKNTMYYINDTIYVNNTFILIIVILIFCGFYSTDKNIWYYISVLISLFIIIDLFLSLFFKAPFQNVLFPMYSFILLFILIQSLENITFKINNRIIYLVGILFFIITIQNFRIKHNSELNEYINIKNIDNEILSLGVTEIYATPMTYKGSHHYRGILSLNEQKLKVFYCGLFSYHPDNIAFKSHWKKDQLLENLRIGINFYFPDEKYNGMLFFEDAFKEVLTRNFKISISSKIVVLKSKNGFILNLKLNNKL